MSVLKLLSVLFLLIGMLHGGMGQECIRIDGKVRYLGWAYRYIAGPDSYVASLRMCHEMSSWGVTDIILESSAISMPWPSEVPGSISTLGYNPPGDFTWHARYDSVDALCKAAKLYNLKIWFAQMARDGYGYDSLMRGEWKKNGGPEYVRKIVSEREKMGMYAKNASGELLTWGGVDYKHHLDLNSRAAADLFKNLLTELKRNMVITALLKDLFTTKPN